MTQQSHASVCSQEIQKWVLKQKLLHSVRGGTIHNYHMVDIWETI